jgi:outer membrane biosynthesis protein TonB
MTRGIVISALVLCPLLIHAQANSPAQTQSPVKSVTLESRLSKPSVPGALPVAASAVPDKSALRVSTGVVFPKLIEAGPVEESTRWTWKPTEDRKIAVVRVLVGADGVPAKVEMLQSVGAKMDSDVLATVSRYRFEAASLDHVKIPAEIHLTVNILNPIQ